MDWEPRPDAAITLDNIRTILDEYRAYGPMTVRQIFYRLVGNYNYDKTELAYNRLAELLVKARRAQLVPFHRIRDSGTESAGGGGWDNRAQFWRSVRRTADNFELDHQLEQPQEIELWCEAAGMVPMLAGMVAEWSIPVYSTGGFGSLTVVKEVADRIADRDVPTVLLHVGDYDPSGESIFTSMTQDIGKFIAEMAGADYYPATGRVPGRFEPVRVALTEAQVEQYDLPTAPPKRSDSRSANWIGETTQAEALPPSLLEEIVQDAVRGHIDQDILDGILNRETEDKAAIDQVLTTAEGEL
jgi:hypothetical protein